MCTMGWRKLPALVLRDRASTARNEHHLLRADCLIEVQNHVAHASRDARHGLLAKLLFVGTGATGFWLAFFAAPRVTPVLAAFAPVITPVMTAFAPVLPTFHARGLSIGI